MPTESKNKTPRTDAKNTELARAILPEGGHPDDGYFGMMNHARQLEKELNEAKSQVEEWKRRFTESVENLTSDCHQLAKQNHQLREALQELQRHHQPLAAHFCLDCYNITVKALDETAPTNLLVLHRDEVEKSKCNCITTLQCVPGTEGPIKVVVGDKCLRCKILS